MIFECDPGGMLSLKIAASIASEKIRVSSTSAKHFFDLIEQNDW